MVSIEGVVVEATTDQQAHAGLVLVVAPDDLPIHPEATASLTLGSFQGIVQSVSLGRSSSFLAAVGDSILGELSFDDESVVGIREARERQF